MKIAWKTIKSTVFTDIFVNCQTCMCFVRKPGDIKSTSKKIVYSLHNAWLSKMHRKLKFNMIFRCYKKFKFWNSAMETTTNVDCIRKIFKIHPFNIFKTFNAYNQLNAGNKKCIKSQKINIAATCLLLMYYQRFFIQW